MEHKYEKKSVKRFNKLKSEFNEIGINDDYLIIVHIKN